MHGGRLHEDPGVYEGRDWDEVGLGKGGLVEPSLERW